MDITVQRDDLLKPLQAVSGVVEKKQASLPILSNLLLATKDGNLSLTGTDGEIELVGFVRLESQSAEGITTVSARKLFDICRTLPEGIVVRLTSEKNPQGSENLMLRAGEGSFLLNTLVASDFPNLEDVEYPVKFSINQSKIKHLLTKTYFAMAQQDVRHFLNGAYLELNHQAIKCVATDGHRLAVATIQDENIINVAKSFILPRKSVMELIRLFGNDSDSEISLYIGDNRFRVVTPDYIFTSKLINTKYPDYRRLIPKGVDIATCDRESLKQALTRASILSNEKFRGVRLQLDANKLRITANNSDQEQAEEDISLDYNGNKMELGFNVAYLLDVMAAMTTKTIRCIFAGPSDGVLIESEENDQSLYVVMPMLL